MSYPAWLRRGSGGSGPILRAARRRWDDSLRSIDLNFRTRDTFLAGPHFQGHVTVAQGGCVRSRHGRAATWNSSQALRFQPTLFSLNKKKRGKGGSKTLPRFAAPWCTRKLQNPFCSSKCSTRCPQTRREAGSITAHTKPSRNEQHQPPQTRGTERQTGFVNNSTTTTTKTKNNPKKLPLGHEWTTVPRATERFDSTRRCGQESAQIDHLLRDVTSSSGTYLQSTRLLAAGRLSGARN